MEFVKFLVVLVLVFGKCVFIKFKVIKEKGVIKLKVVFFKKLKVVKVKKVFKKGKKVGVVKK